MLSPRRRRRSVEPMTDDDSWQTPDRSVSPFPPKLSMSGTNLTISSEHEGQEIHSETSTQDKENGNSDKESEFYYKPVRRGIALAQEIHDEYLICKICLEDYKSPKSLDCMHTFCEQCIENHAMSESTYKKYSDYRDFTCPLCRKRTQLPLGGVRKLPDNQLLMGLMKSVARRRPLMPIMSFVKCDICRSPISYSETLSEEDDLITAKGAGSHSAARCLDCCKVLCHSCVIAHLSTAVTQTHSVYDPTVVADILKDPNALECREHCNETVEYYCIDCQRCVCLLCAFDDQAVEPHVNHELVDLGTAAERHQSSLHKLCHSVSANVSGLESELLALTTCTNHVDSIRRQIQTTAESFRRLINTEELKLLDQLDVMYGGGDPHTDGRAAAAALKERVVRLSTVRRLAESVAERRGIELLLLHTEVENRLRREQELAQVNQPGGGSTNASGGAGGFDANIIRKRVEFVPGLVNLGRLGVMETSSCTATGSGRGEVLTNGLGSCPTCHRQPAALFKDNSTITTADGAVAGVLKLDKAVNTKARGLRHNCTSGNVAGSVHDAGASTLLLTSSSVNIMVDEHQEEQLPIVQ